MSPLAQVSLQNDLVSSRRLSVASTSEPGEMSAIYHLGFQDGDRKCTGGHLGIQDGGQGRLAHSFSNLIFCLFLIYCPLWKYMSTLAQVSLQKDRVSSEWLSVASTLKPSEMSANIFFFSFWFLSSRWLPSFFCFVLSSSLYSILLIFIGWIFEIDFLHNQT